MDIVSLDPALIEHFDVIDASGPDAVGFLHAQLASDVRALAPGGTQFSTWLNPQGRAIAVLALARVAEDRVLLAVPHGRGIEIADRLRRFVLRSKVKLDAAPTLRVVGGSAAPSGALATLVLPDARVISIVAATSAPVAGDAWALADVRAGVPWLTAEVTEQFVPHALGLGRLGAYSVNKGCYPGQEIVARTHFLGRNKRLLARYVRTGTPLGPADRLNGAEDAAAIVVTEVAAGAMREGLAVVHEDTLKDIQAGFGLHPFEDQPVTARGRSAS